MHTVKTALTLSMLKHSDDALLYIFMVTYKITLQNTTYGSYQALKKQHGKCIPKRKKREGEEKERNSEQV